MTVATIIASAAQAAGISTNLLLALCWQESRHQSVINPVDGRTASYGICQIKLKTAREVAPEIRPSELLDPATNARIAAAILKRHITRRQGHVDCAIVAYNRGHARCGELLNSEGPAYLRSVRAAMESQPWKTPL